MAWGKITVAAVLLLSLISCKTLEEKIVGTWVSEDNNHSVEFKGDSTAVFESYGRTVTANYAFTDKNHARFEFHEPFGELEGIHIARITQDKDNLELEFESGVTKSFVRSKS